jgi:hypothetical protein
MRVMALPIASVPPAVVENENVAETPILVATRSEDATKKETFVTWPPITPELMPDDGIVSILVHTEMLPPVLGAPMVRPASVTVTAVFAASAFPDVTRTMEVLPGIPGVSVAPLAECVTVGVADVAKNPDG